MAVMVAIMAVMVAIIAVWTLLLPAAAAPPLDEAAAAAAEELPPSRSSLAKTELVRFGVATNAASTKLIEKIHLTNVCNYILRGHSIMVQDVGTQ